MIRLIFRGQLLPGKDPDTVIAALAQQFGGTEAVIRSRLFTGRPVVIKTVASPQEARRYVLAFARCGAVLHTEAVTTAGTLASEQTTDKPERRPFPIFIAMAGLSLAAVLLWAAWYTSVLWYVSPGDRGIEAAELFDEGDLIAAVYLDLARSRTLMHRFGPGNWQPPASTQGLQALTSQLERFGLDPLSDIDHLWLTLHRLGESYRWAVLLEGRFDETAFRQWLAARHQVERIDADTGITYFRWRGRRLCQPETLKAAHIADDRILIADSGHLPKLRQQLEAGSSGGGAHHWGLRAGHVAAVVVPRPNEFTAFASDETRDFWARMRAGLGGNSTLYADLKPSLFPPGLNLKATLRGYQDNVARLRQTLWTLGHSSAGSPLAGAMLSGTDRELSLQIPLNTVDSAEHTLWSLLSAVRGLPAGRPTPDGQPPIAAPTPAPLGAAARSMLGEFADSAGFRPQWTHGPFGLRIGALTATDDRLLMTLEGRSRPLPAVIREGALPRLSVMDVFNNQGRSLLNHANCGPDLNRRSVTFSRNGSQLLVSKPLMLRPDSRLERVAAIRGAIDLTLPTRLHTEVLEDPGEDTLTRTHGVMIRLHRQPSDTLAYHLGGEYRRIVAVRARDANGTLMEGTEMQRVTLPFSLGHEVIERFHAPVTGVEVMLAAELEPMRYPFAMTSPYPPASAKPTPPAGLPRPVDDRQWRLALKTPPPSMAEIGVEPRYHGSAGPLTLIIAERAAGPAPAGTIIEAYATADFPLARHLGGLQLDLHRAQSASGEWIPIETHAPLTLLPAGSVGGGPAALLKASWPLVIDSRGLDTPQSYAGNITVNLPIGMATRRLSPVPGSRWQGRHLDVVVQRWSAEGLALAIDGDIARLVAATALDANGQRADGEVRLRPSDDHTAVLTMALHAVPRWVILTYADRLRRQTLPVLLHEPGAEASQASFHDRPPRGAGDNAAQP